MYKHIIYLLCMYVCIYINIISIINFKCIIGILLKLVVITMKILLKIYGSVSDTPMYIQYICTYTHTATLYIAMSR